MVGKGLVKRLAAALAVAGCAFVVIVSLGATVFYALQLVVTPLAAAALTALIFAALAGIIGAVFLGKAGAYDDPEGDDEPLGLGARAVQLFRQRPILGVAAAVAGGFIFLRNPALATMVAAAFTEQSRPRRRR
jgi:membrane glycosyltransferase